MRLFLNFEPLVKAMLLFFATWYNNDPTCLRTCLNHDIEANDFAPKTVAIND